MNETVRSAYLETARAVIDLLGRVEVGDRWQDASVLPEFEVGALAGHLARGILTVHWYLDMPEPDPPVITAAEYYAAHGAGDIQSEADRKVRERGADTAKGGWARLYLDTSRAGDHLAERLQHESAEHRIPAFGRVLLIDEYLKTRIVEMVFHLEDFGRSLEQPVPRVPPEALQIAIAVLVDAARVRHGDRAVLHALGRRELDKVDALRVL